MWGLHVPTVLKFKFVGASLVWVVEGVQDIVRWSGGNEFKNRYLDQAIITDLWGEEERWLRIRIEVMCTRSRVCLNSYHPQSYPIVGWKLQFQVGSYERKKKTIASLRTRRWWRRKQRTQGPSVNFLRRTCTDNHAYVGLTGRNLAEYLQSQYFSSFSLFTFFPFLFTCSNYFSLKKLWCN